MHLFLSHLIDENTPMYGGKKGFSKTQLRSIKKGDTCNTSEWKVHSHIGTHIDVPYHFDQDGKTIDDLTSNFWVADGKEIQVIELLIPKDTYLIKQEHIKNEITNYEARVVLLKTGFQKERDNKKYWEENPGLSLDFVEFINEKFKKIKILGLDVISVSSWQNRQMGRKVHRKLLKSNKPIAIIEDMNLAEISCKTNFKNISISPLRIIGADASPVTIIAEIKG